MPTDADDDWADLYRDLGLDTAKAAPAPAEPEEPASSADLFGGEPDEPDAEREPESETEAESESEGEEPAEGEAGSAEEETNPDGTPKKRRRRRRRRSGRREDGPEGAEAAEAGESADAADTPLPDAARDLIAQWDVPSWADVVAGLYRPTGGR